MNTSPWRKNRIIGPPHLIEVRVDMLRARGHKYPPGKDCPWVIFWDRRSVGSTTPATYERRTRIPLTHLTEWMASNYATNWVYHRSNVNDDQRAHHRCLIDMVESYTK